MTSPLFRHEVVDARRDSWLGDTHLAQPISVRLTVILCFVFILSSVVYVIFGTYTRRVHAQGLLTPNIGLITLASPVAGRVGSSGVKEGDRVEQGQLLYVIDLDAVSANGPTQKQVIAELDRQKRSMEKQRALRVSTAETEKRSLAEQIENLKAQAGELGQQVAIQEKLVPPLKKRVEVLANALSKGLARAADLQSQNYLYMQATAQLAQFKQAALQIKGRLEDLETQYINFDDKLAHELAEIDRASAQLAQQKAESEAKRAIEIRAPVKGMLTSIRAQAGQSVAAGSTLLTLLPSEGRLQANLYVDSSAIGFIETGAAVMLRYAAFPFQRFGLYRGVVTEVTRAPLDAGEVLAAAGVAKDKPHRGVYRVVVKPEQDAVMAYGELRSLEAGMRVEADIALEKRPLYRWLLDPLYRAKRSVDLVTEGG